MNYRIYSYIVMFWLLLVDNIIIRYYLDRDQLYVFRIVMLLLISAGSAYYVVRKWRDETTTEEPLWKMITALFVCLFWTTMVIIRYF